MRMSIHGRNQRTAKVRRRHVPPSPALSSARAESLQRVDSNPAVAALQFTWLMQDAAAYNTLLAAGAQEREAVSHMSLRSWQT